ncbi:MAG: flavin reductase family protein [Eubacterium sp.]|nr:flavin reductase family protein [Eubacterium sp.]
MEKKQQWKPGNMLYPVPAVMVSCGNQEGKKNIFTVAWTGTINSDPAMVSISVRPERYSYSLIRESGEFVINLTTKKLCYATDWCGVKSGRDVDKWKEMKLTAAPANTLKYAPIIEESPVNIECRVKEIIPLGTHDMFLAEVTGVQVSEKHMNETGKFELNETELVTYSHGEYFTLGEKIGKFGYSVKK